MDTQMADRQAIAAQIYRYCRAMDRIDVQLGYGIWHPEGTADYEGFYSGTGRGFIDAVCAAHRNTLMHAHQVTNILIELDGARAGSESYYTANVRVMAGGSLTQMTVWGRYIDRWSRREGLWALDHRLALRDFDEIRDVTPMSQASLARRDKTDPSYEVLPRG